MWLRQRLQDGQMTLDYQDGPKVVTREGGRQEGQSREGDVTVEADVGRMWKTPQTKECSLWELEKARK